MEALRPGNVNVQIVSAPERIVDRLVQRPQKAQVGPGRCKDRGLNRACGQCTVYKSVFMFIVQKTKSRIREGSPYVVTFLRFALPQASAARPSEDSVQRVCVQTDPAACNTDPDSRQEQPDSRRQNT